MSYNDYITIDNKQYKAQDMGPDSFQQVFDRQKTYEIGLTGATIMQDFTVTANNIEREPHSWKMTLKVYISERPATEWALWSDLLVAYRKLYVPMIYFDGSTQWNIGILSPIVPVARVWANIEGHCYGVYYVDVNLQEVYGA
jgi:hypothetical protein